MCPSVPTKSQHSEVLLVRLIGAKDPNKFIEPTFIVVAMGRDAAHHGVTWCATSRWKPWRWRKTGDPPVRLPVMYLHSYTSGFTLRQFLTHCMRVYINVWKIRLETVYLIWYRLLGFWFTSPILYINFSLFIWFSIFVNLFLLSLLKRFDIWLNFTYGNRNTWAFASPFIFCVKSNSRITLLKNNSILL